MSQPEVFQKLKGTAPRVVELDRHQQATWEQCRAGMLWSAPACSHIFYTLMNPRGGNAIAYFTDQVPIAATDGVNLFLNPARAFLSTYSLGNRVFMCAHEIFHCVLNHPAMMLQLGKRGYVIFSDGTQLPFYPEIMNIAMDYVINDLLIKSGIGTYNKEWLHDPTMGLAEDSVVDVYQKLFKSGKVKFVNAKDPSKPCNAKAGPGKGDQVKDIDTRGQKSFDELLEPGTGEGLTPEEGAEQRNEQEWQTGVAAARAPAEAQGKLPAALKRLFSELLEPQVDWREKIRALFFRSVGEDIYSWQRLNRRLITRGIGAPGRLGNSCGTIVVGGDTSGSINDATVNMFLAEIAGILDECQPEQLILLWCDAKVHRADYLEDTGDLNKVRHDGAPGGGGTDFRPVFDWIDKEGVEPDALIYLTDLLGSFPQRKPAYPVIWGSILKEQKAPFGETIFIPKQA